MSISDDLNYFNANPSKRPQKNRLPKREAVFYWSR